MNGWRGELMSKLERALPLRSRYDCHVFHDSKKWGPRVVVKTDLTDQEVKQVRVWANRRLVMSDIWEIVVIWVKYFKRWRHRTIYILLFWDVIKSLALQFGLTFMRLFFNAFLKWVTQCSCRSVHRNAVRRLKEFKVLWGSRCNISPHPDSKMPNK